MWLLRYMEHYSYKNKLGYLNLSLKDGYLHVASFGDKKTSTRILPLELKKELDTYFAGGSFSRTFLKKYVRLELLSGTDFQKHVWSAISCIPHGRTVLYTDLAKSIGNEKAVRACGTACGKNPLALFVPCHRVVRKTGEDFGYSWGAERKKYLLILEKSI